MIVLDSSMFPRTQRKVVDELVQAMQLGEFKIGEAIGSDIELSRRYGVSRNTVRSVARTLEVAGVVRQVPRRGVFLNQQFELAGGGDVAPAAEREYLFLTCGTGRSPMETEIIQGLQQYAAVHRMRVKVLSGGGSAERLIALLDGIPAGSGVALIPCEFPGLAAAIERTMSREVRILQVDRALAGVNAPAIAYDDYAAGVLATTHLLEQAHRPVWFFGVQHPESAQLRFQGWRDAMCQNGFANFDDYIIPCGGDDPQAEFRPARYYHEAFRAFYQQHRTETLSIWCMADSLALYVYAVAAECGRRIGSDILLVGSGDIASARSQDPPLSSIHNDQVKMGEQVAELLLQWPEIPYYKQILPLNLVVRASSGVRD